VAAGLCGDAKSGSAGVPYERGDIGRVRSFDDGHNRLLDGQVPRPAHVRKPRIVGQPDGAADDRSEVAQGCHTSKLAC
jgi:hypothetical protein